MRNLRLDNVTIVLIGACFLTAASVFLFGLPEPSWQGHVRENGTARNEDDNKEIGASQRNAYINTPIGGYSEILERPLFSSSRRHREEVSYNGRAQTYESPTSKTAERDLILIGIIIVGGDRFALLQVKGSQKIEKVQVGDLIEGWRIVSLSKSTASMQRRKESQTLEMARNSDPRFTPRSRSTRWR